MINFFRRIKQSLLSQNKFSKYLLYAIGEILLVMIGILLALQVNNWNDNRKARQQEKSILEKVNVDLKANLKEIKGVNNITQLRLNACKTILNYFDEKKSVDDSLKLSFELINNDDLFNNANTTYKYIENQGMNVLSNDSLQAKITWMYERHFKNISNRENKNWQIVLNNLRPIMDPLFESTEIQQSFYGWEYALNNPLNYDALTTNVHFRNIIIRLQNYLMIRSHWQRDTLKELENLISELEIEISGM